MKFIHNILLTVVLALALSACGTADEPYVPVAPEPDAPEALQDCKLSLYISLSDDVVSRAPVDSLYDAGRGYENFIDIGTNIYTQPDMWIALFNDNGEFLTVIDSFLYTLVPLEDYNSSKHYLLEFTLPVWLASQIDEKPFRLLMMVNCYGNYPDMNYQYGPTSAYPLTDLNSWWGAKSDYVNFVPRNVDGPEDKIPMFGVCRYSGVKLQNNNTVGLKETLHLLRALAKVDVYDNVNTTSPLTKVELVNYSPVSIPYPNGVSHQDEYVKGSYADDYVATGRMNFSGKITIGNVPFEKVNVDGYSNAYRIYCTVFQNVRSDGQALPETSRTRMKLTFADGYSKIIDFRDYSKFESDNSAYFNLNRNYWYKFKVTNRSISVDVLPYGVVDLQPGFGID